MNQFYISIKIFLLKKFKKDIYIYKDNIYHHDPKIIDIFDKLNFVPSVKIKDVWNDMTNYNKDICWKYFKAFILLCEKLYKYQFLESYLYNKNIWIYAKMFYHKLIV